MKPVGTKNFIRGGQIVLHNLRMFRQITLRVMLCVLILFVIVLGAWLTRQTTPYERYVTKAWITAKIKLIINSQAEQTFKQPDGEESLVYSRSITHSQAVKRILEDVISILYDGLWAGGLFFLVSFSILVVWLKKRGRKQTEDRRIRGDYLDTPHAVKKIIKRNKQTSKFVVSSKHIPIPKFSIWQHFFLHGTTGSGKSRLVRQLLDQIRAMGDRAIIYDKGCVLTQEYYDPNCDSLINPLDARTVAWDLWKECRDLAELEGFASAQIPKAPGLPDPYWVDGARTIFSQAAHRMRKLTPKPKLLPLLKYLLTADLEEIKYLLRGTVAETLMSEKIEKSALSIKAILATYLKSLCYVKESDDAFTLREWIEGQNTATQFLFVSSIGNKHATLKPLITAWIDRAVTALLSLSVDPNRRLWFILDEYTSLHQIPQVGEGLSEGRKFGGCFLIGLQNQADLRKIYGYNGAESISSLLNTRFMFRQPDPKIAAWSAENLGETITESVNESVSYGANTIRDGVSISRSKKKEPVVMSSEIMKLEDLACYLRLAGDYPISKVNIPYIEHPVKNEAFIPRELASDDLRNEVEELIETVKAADRAEQSQQKKKASKSNPPSLKKKDKKIEQQHALDI